MPLPRPLPLRRLLPLLTLCASCLTSGCSSGALRTPVAPTRVAPPPNLLAPPPRLPMPASGRPTDLLSNHIEVARLYHQLADQMCNLLAYLQQPIDPTHCPAPDHDDARRIH